MQAQLCLSVAYPECPDYQEASVQMAAVPLEWGVGAGSGASDVPRMARLWQRRPKTLGAVCVIGLVTFCLLWLGAAHGRLSYELEAARVTYTSIEGLTALPTATDNATFTPASTGTATATPIPTPTATPRPVAEAPPTRIRIPKIGVDADVVEVAFKVVYEEGQKVTVWQVADYAAGFHRGSAYPGHAGNTVIAAHNNIRGRVFRHLVELVPGDAVYLYVGQQEFHYIVTERILVKEKDMSEEIRRENAEWIQPTEDERLTLVSCWPFIKPDHRVIIVAQPSDLVEFVAH